MDHQTAGDAVHVPTGVRRGAADVDRVHTGTGIDGGQAGRNRLNVDDVVTAGAIEGRGRCRVGAQDVEGIRPRAEEDIQGLDLVRGVVVADARAQIQAGDLGRRQVARLRAIFLVVDVEGVAAALAVDHQTPDDAVHVSTGVRRGAADVDRIHTRAGIDGRLGVDGHDVDDV